MGDDRPTQPAPPPDVSNASVAGAVGDLLAAFAGASARAWEAVAPGVTKILLRLVADAYASGVAHERGAVRPFLAAYVAAATATPGGVPTVGALVTALVAGGHPMDAREAQEACCARGLALDL